MAPEICPNCGAEVPRKAAACPDCGSSEETGWSEAAVTSGLDLPEENFDYEAFVRREFNDPGKPKGLTRFWRIVGIITLVIFVLGLIGIGAIWYLL